MPELARRRKGEEKSVSWFPVGYVRGSRFRREHSDRDQFLRRPHHDEAVDERNAVETVPFRDGDSILRERIVRSFGRRGEYHRRSILAEKVEPLACGNRRRPSARR